MLSLPFWVKCIGIIPILWITMNIPNKDLHILSFRNGSSIVGKLWSTCPFQSGKKKSILFCAKQYVSVTCTIHYKIWDNFEIHVGNKETWFFLVTSPFCHRIALMYMKQTAKSYLDTSKYYSVAIGIKYSAHINFGSVQIMFKIFIDETQTHNCIVLI